MGPKNLLLALIAGVASLAIFNVGAVHLTRNVLLDMPALEAAAEYDRIGREAMAKYPNLGIIEARARYSNERLEKALNAAHDDDMRARLAAEAFVGFWMVHGRARAEFCEAAGIDFSDFRERFENRNRSLYNAALPLVVSRTLSEERLWDRFDEIIRGQLDFEMLYLKNGHPMPTERAEACQFLLDRRAEILPRLDFRVASPAAYRALIAHQSK